MLNSIGRIVLLDVSQPSYSHGWTVLISQTVNLFSNCSTIVHPNVVRKTKINAYLKKFNKHNNSNNVINYRKEQ